MKFDILNRWTGKIQFTAEIDCEDDTSRSLKVGLAVKWGAENNADLRNANLRNATGNMKQVKTIQVEGYSISYTSRIIQIGCERHTIEEWQGFDDKRILRMDGKDALKFWHKWKDWIFLTIERSPAMPCLENDDKEEAA